MEAWHIITMTPVFRVLAIIQLLLFIFLFVMTLLFKFYQNQHAAKEKKIIQRLNQYLLDFDSLSPQDLQYLKAHRRLSFAAFYLLEQQGQLSNQIIQDIIHALYLDTIKNDVSSRSWSIRNYAALNYQLRNKYLKNMSAIDEQHLLNLLADPVPLVAINAAIAICFDPRQQTVDRFIDIFCQQRRAQYDLLTEVLHASALKMMPFIEQRLNNEKNIYIRVFCYRMLRQLPKMELILSTLDTDIHSAIIDLRLAALAYIAYAQTNDYKIHLSNAINADAWEIRARAAKLIGYTKDTFFLDTLSLHLSDTVWWVRFRSAEALGMMGAQGRAILSSQKIDVDKFAYEMSQQQLEFSRNQQQP